MSVEFSIITDYFTIEKEVIAIEAVASLNLKWMEENDPLCLGCKSIKYLPPPQKYRSDTIVIRDISQILKDGSAKCDEIVAVFLAFEWYNNREAYAYIENKGNGLYHAKAINEFGEVLDPSLNLKYKQMESPSCLCPLFH